MSVQIDKQQVLDAFQFRCAMRKFDSSKKISDPDFAYLLELARLSPSSVGSEPWKFLVLQNPALRQALVPHCWGGQKQLQDASHIVVILARRNARYDSADFYDTIKKRGFNEEQIAKTLAVYQKFQQHDIKILDSERALFDWASKQTYIALANMMTGAALIGIDSCPIEGFDYDKVNQILIDAGLFDPTEFGVSVMAAFGYRAADPSRAKTRKSLQEVVQWVE